MNNAKVITKYYPNGKVFSTAEYKLKNGDTVFHGLMKYYFPNGTLHQEFHYRDGMKNGVHNVFQQNGKKTAEVMYENNIKYGYARFYSDTGYNYIIFSDDTMLKSKSFYPNGSLQSVYIFFDQHSLRYLLELDSFRNKIEEMGTINKADTTF